MVHRRALIVLLVCLAFSVGGVLVGRKLVIHSELKRLFPDSTPSITRLKATSDLFGNTSEIILAVSSKDRKANIDYLARIAPLIGKLKEVKFVRFRRAPKFFEDNALLYTSIPDLKDLQKKVNDKIDAEVKKANPFFISLDDDDDDDDKKKPRKKVVDIEEEKERLKKKYQKKIKAFKEYRENKKGDLVALRVRPVTEPTDVAFGAAIVGKIEKIIKDNPPPGGMRVETGGDYHSKIRAVKGMGSKLISSLVPVLIGILLLFIIYYRRVRSVLLIFLPLGIGITWSLGITVAVVGHLNIISTFIYAVLFGLGVDFGIHMLARYTESRRLGMAVPEALEIMFTRVGRASFSAMITTTLAFSSLLFSSFKGLSEFGLIAALGMPATLIAMLTAFPALIVLTEKVLPLISKKGVAAPRAPISTERLRRPAIIGTVLSIALLVLGVVGTFHFQFEDNFNNLKGYTPKSKLTKVKKVEKSLVRRYFDEIDNTSPSPAVATTRSLADTHLLHLEMKRLFEQKKDVYDYHSIWNLLPDPRTQKEKLKILAAMKRRIDRKKNAIKNKKSRKKLEDLRKLCVTKTIGPKDLPEWLTRLYRDKKGNLGLFGFLWLRKNKASVRETAWLNKTYGQLQIAPGKKVPVSAGYFILGELQPIIDREVIFMGLGSLIMVVLILLLYLRSWWKTLVVLSPLALGVMFMFGGMMLMGLKFSMFNIIVLPMILGVGVDDGIHLFHRYQEETSSRVWKMLRTTGGAAIVTTLTTAIGFSSMLTAHHHGLEALAKTAIVGLVSCLFAALITFPSILVLKELRDRKKTGKSGNAQ